MLGVSDESSDTVRQFVEEAADELARGLETMIGQTNATMTSFTTRQTDMEKKIKSLEWRASQSNYDELTGVLNRRGFLGRAERVLSDARERGVACGIGFVDLDDFKAINDQHGHAMGDLVLKAVSQVLRDSVREGGSVGRLGGDEFGFLILAGDGDEAKQAVEKIAGRVNTVKVTDKKKTVEVTLSIGLLWLGVPDQGQSVQLALKQADELMYKVKREGKAGWAIDQAKAALLAG